LVPTDFSLCAEKEINFAVQSVKYIPAKITLYHAFDLQGDIYTDYMGVTKEYNQSLYNDVVQTLNAIKDDIIKSQAKCKYSCFEKIISKRYIRSGRRKQH
ncbi:MAG: hypothetical protein ABI594_17420, partial [Ginsengibacter sp.]